MKQKNTINIEDPEIINMDPVQKIWMYNNWIQDQNDKAELAKNTAYLIGSFTNPEAVKSLLSKDSEQHTSTEEEFEESLDIVKSGKPLFSEEVIQPTKRKRRRIKV